MRPGVNIDGQYRVVREKGINGMVPWYLMASFAYYHCNESILSDECFDELCRDMAANWDRIEHQHKHVVDYASLSAGTGFTLGIGDYPTMTRAAASNILKGPPFRSPIPSWMILPEPVPPEPGPVIPELLALQPAAAEPEPTAAAVAVVDDRGPEPPADEAPGMTEQELEAAADRSWAAITETWKLPPEKPKKPAPAPEQFSLF